MKDKTQKIKTQKPQVNPEVVALKNQLARVMADYDNLTKRTQDEKVMWVKFATGKFIQNLLPILDNFESAQNHLKDSGLAIAIMQFKDALKSEGLEEITPKVGDGFDENLEEVIEAIEGKDEGKIAEVVLPGWKFMDGQVIRHAKVKVYKLEAKNSS